MCTQFLAALSSAISTLYVLIESIAAIFAFLGFLHLMHALGFLLWPHPHLYKSHYIWKNDVDMLNILGLVCEGSAASAPRSGHGKAATGNSKHICIIVI